MVRLPQTLPPPAQDSNRKSKRLRLARTPDPIRLSPPAYFSSQALKSSRCDCHVLGLSQLAHSTRGVPAAPSHYYFACNLAVQINHPPQLEATVP